MMMNQLSYLHLWEIIPNYIPLRKAIPIPTVWEIIPKRNTF